MLPALRGLRGLSGPTVAGSVITGTQVGVNTQLSAKNIGIAAAAGTLAAIAPFTGPAAPFLMAAAALIGPIASMFKGCGATCTQATAYANDAASALAKLHDDYFAQPVRYASMQAGTLGLMQQVMGSLQQLCGNPALGAAGQRCISERLIRGAPAPWCDKPNKIGCDIWTVIYDPVANDPNVIPDPVADTVLNSFGINPQTKVFGVALSDLILPAGALLLILAMGDD